jgi:hypothetical protein
MFQFGRINPSNVATRLEGAAASWCAALEDRQDPCLNNWDAFTAELEAEFTITRTVAMPC